MVVSRSGYHRRGLARLGFSRAENRADIGDQRRCQKIDKLLEEAVILERTAEAWSVGNERLFGAHGAAGGAMMGASAPSDSLGVRSRRRTVARLQ